LKKRKRREDEGKERTNELARIRRRRDYRKIVLLGFAAGLKDGMMGMGMGSSSNL
jgi:uncharacterized membrane protein YfcA